MINLGLLYPSSQAHPSIGMDFLAGLQAFLKATGLEAGVQLATESTGFGGAEKEVYQKAESLLLTGNTDVLVAFVDLKVLSLLQPLLQASGKPSLVVNPGANYPDNWVPPSNVLYLTLQHAFLCWLTGRDAARSENKAAALTSTFYDCGYLHLAAMVKQFMQYGGSLQFNYINKQPYDASFHINELAAFLEEQPQTKNLLCVFDDKPAALFYNCLNAFPAADNLRLFVSPMMLEEAALRDSKDFRFSVEGYRPWHPSLAGAANEHFTRRYTEQTGKAANIFALLGWETGLVLQQIILLRQAGTRGTEGLVEGLTGLVLESPRGSLTLDGETHYFVAGAQKCTIPAQAGAPEVEWVQNLEKEWQAFVAQPAEGVSSGWSNTYLCY